MVVTAWGGARNAMSVAGHPPPCALEPVRGKDPAVQRIVTGGATQGVGCVQDLVVFEVGGLAVPFARHI